MPEKNSKAPDFEALDENGIKFKLSDHIGKWTVLYFYPKDDTPGCTKEACSFRDGYGELLKMGVNLIGVSMDGVDSHKKFKTKYQLPFTLVSDTDKKIIQDYGVLNQKSMFGKSFLGVNRSTFIIDPEGKIAEIFKGVKVDGHFEQIVQSIKKLTKSDSQH